MPRLRIRHETTYTYSEPVRFGPWRLLMRPLDTHATRLIEASLETPPGTLTWSYDAYGNCVCHLTPAGVSDQLSVVNNLLVDRYPSPLADVSIDKHPGSMAPIVYSMADRAILEPFLMPATDDQDSAYLDWLRSLVPATGEPAIEFLKRLNGAIHAQFQYATRDSPGTQSPAETLLLNAGTCRDFAWLMIESVRRLGFAARFATGYLFSPGATIRGAGATHAWCEVFLPDLGWTEFDPTNALVESASLIRVATTRTWQEADPMSGTTYGNANCVLGVAVDVDMLDAGARAVAELGGRRVRVGPSLQPEDRRRQMASPFGDGPRVMPVHGVEAIGCVMAEVVRVIATERVARGVREIEEVVWAPVPIGESAVIVVIVPVVVDASHGHVTMVISGVIGAARE